MSTQSTSVNWSCAKFSVSIATYFVLIGYRQTLQQTRVRVRDALETRFVLNACFLMALFTLEIANCSSRTAVQFSVRAINDEPLYHLVAVARGVCCPSATLPPLPCTAASCMVLLGTLIWRRRRRRRIV